MNWLNETRDMLANRPRHITLKDIADATGLTEAWLKKISYDDKVDPRVTAVQTLYNYLKDAK